MCHLWQHVFEKPSRTGYHNNEWAKKTQAVGLMPSSTGKNGGHITGQKISNYPIEDGVFMKAYQRIPETTLLPFKAYRKQSKMEMIMQLINVEEAVGYQSYLCTYPSIFKYS